jgi:hypothetical protein
VKQFIVSKELQALSLRIDKGLPGLSAAEHYLGYVVREIDFHCDLIAILSY